MIDVRDQGHARWVIYSSLLVSLFMMIWPLPDGMAPVRPEWTVLLVIYWVITLPQLSMLVICLIGLVLDLLEANLLGQHALGLMVISYICLLSYQRLRLYVLWHQCMIIFVFVGIYQLLDHWSHSLSGVVTTSNMTFLMPAFTSALMWPVVRLIMEKLRRHFRVS